MTKKTQICIGYCRVSTAEQATNGDSLETQEATIRQWAKTKEYQLAGIYIDAGLSGKRADNREQLQLALTDACNQKAAIVVSSLSRLARSTIDALTISERLHKAGADLVSLTEQIDTTCAAGKMVFRMLAVLAEFERDLISERTSAVLQYKKQRRELYGNVPFGYTLVDGQLVPNKAEKKAIKLMKTMRANGKTLREIAGRLTRDGVSTKGGGKWYAGTIKKVLENDLHQDAAKQLTA